ncbi:membrane protein [Patiriisocius marinistellae]|uniref:Membrane protein n=1 Tax=Patiriisocius marinistellae TaxID=2494560 RepID=A0A5J4FXN6_9FLAO|nr:membrane protein [Patiriisocius marinistellae]
MIDNSPQFSVITLGPGDNLNDSFGHNAFRFTDAINNIDVVYDYGRFDFDTPNFYIKFARGKLPYALGRAPYTPFIEHYENQERTIKEQVLDLTTEEAITLFEYLENNYLPMNRNYKYDFFYDNCATKMRDVLVEVLGSKLKFSDSYVLETKTFRTLIQERLNTNTWGSLGIDVALGAVIDRQATPWEHQFLPAFVHKAISEASITESGVEKPLVKKSITIYNAVPKENTNFFFTSPLFIFSLIAIFICYITYRDFNKSNRTRWLDSVLFFVTGLVGFLLIPLWFGTDHTATANNYNLLWAVPLNLLFFTLIGSKTPKKWLRRYVFFLILMLILMGVHWVTGVEVFAIGLLPLLIAMMVRYIYLLKYLGIKKEVEA